jgi:hypothetical protein
MTTEEVSVMADGCTLSVLYCPKEGKERVERTVMNISLSVVLVI